MFHDSEEHQPVYMVYGLADNLGLEFDYQGRVIRVLKRVTFQDGFLPPKTHQGWKVEAVVSSEVEEQSTVVDGVLFSDLVLCAGDDAFVALGYFWKDVAQA